MQRVRFGIIGMGSIGKNHAKYIFDGKVQGAVLTAVCNTGKSSNEEWIDGNLDKSVQVFNNVETMLNSKIIDAVIIATPHSTHPNLAIHAFNNDLNVLIEKPAGVYTKNVREMNKVAKDSGKIFGIMYNQRTNPLFQRLKNIVENDEIGSIKRISWNITGYYRTQSYYDSSEWRATWNGEGGGALINQCSHNLDIWQWIFGMPQRIRSFCNFGKYRDIEVEDEVVAYMEYESGTIGTLIVSNSECLGENRLEVVGNLGKIVVEGKKLIFYKFNMPEDEFNKLAGLNEWNKFEYSVTEETIEDIQNGRAAITNNYVNTILNGTELLAPGEDGINALMLCNAMYLSTWNDGWIDLPIDDDLYVLKLNEAIEKYKK
jgi:predicted dehydrogenase